ncbi:hypothetical protein B0H13DRAFT_1912285 [Mycena leptocephala]|nr:hypothetical protein B0H13DRAFT_1912285 [Mycena leptocephala]
MAYLGLALKVDPVARTSRIPIKMGGSFTSSDLSPNLIPLYLNFAKSWNGSWSQNANAFWPDTAGKSHGRGFMALEWRVTTLAMALDGVTHTIKNRAGVTENSRCQIVQTADMTGSIGCPTQIEFDAYSRSAKTAIQWNFNSPKLTFNVQLHSSTRTKFLAEKSNQSTRASSVTPVFFGCKDFTLDFNEASQNPDTSKRRLNFAASQYTTKILSPRTYFCGATAGDHRDSKSKRETFSLKHRHVRRVSERQRPINALRRVNVPGVRMYAVLVMLAVLDIRSMSTSVPQAGSLRMLAQKQQGGEMGRDLPRTCFGQFIRGRITRTLNPTTSDSEPRQWAYDVHLASSSKPGISQGPMGAGHGLGAEGWVLLHDKKKMEFKARRP